MQTESKYKYNPTTFAGQLIPDAPVGEWDATVVRGRSFVKPTSKGDPMVSFTVRLDAACDNPENEAAQGTQLTYRVFFPSKAAKPFYRNKSTKNLFALCRQARVDVGIIPAILSDPEKGLTPEETLSPFIAAIEGAILHVWTTHRLNDRGETLVDIELERPGAFGGANGSTTSARDDD